MTRLAAGLIGCLLMTGAAWPAAAPVPGAPADAEVEAWAATQLAAHRVPGLALAVMRGDSLAIARGFGVQEAAGHSAVTPATVFQLGSISKQFLAALVLRLAELDRVSLDDEVRAHLPSFDRLPRGLTVRHLLNHTSGIREPFTMPAYQAGIGDLDRSAAELVDILRGAPVDFAPGTRWSYSNANYHLLALVVERVTGQPYERELSAHFFEPLRLPSIGACPNAPSGPAEARGHVLTSGTLAPAPIENMKWIRGDGGLCGNAVDVARWTRLLATGRVIRPATYDTMRAPTRLTSGEVAEYGFALSVVGLDGRRKVAHNGAMPGFSASAAYYPDDELTVVVLTNRGDVRTEAIERQAARRLLGLPEPDRSERPLPDGAARRLAGSYDIGVFAVHIAERDGRLWLEMPPPGPTTPLRHLGGGEWVSDRDPDAVQVSVEDGAGAAPSIRLLMAAMRWYGVRQAAPAAGHPRQSGTLPSGVYYEASGTGDAVVFVHAFSVDRRMWDPQVRAFEDRYRVIRFDLRGHGRSGAPLEPYTGYGDLRSVLDALAIPRATIVGLSAGSELAINFAITDPDRVSGLVLAAPGLGGYKVPPLPWMSPVFEAAAAGDAALAARRWAATPIMTVKSGGAAAVTVETLVMENQSLWKARRTEQPLTPPAAGRLGEIRCPALVIVGDADLPHISDVASVLTRGIAGASLVTIPGAGHIVNLDRPEPFNDALAAFLARRPNR